MLTAFMLCVLVNLGCYNKLPYTGRLKQETFLSHLSGDWKSRIRGWHCWVLVRCLFLVERELPSCLLLKGTHPTHEGSTLMASSPSTGTTSRYHYIGVRVPTHKGTQTHCTLFLKWLPRLLLYLMLVGELTPFFGFLQVFRGLGMLSQNLTL